jgi:hypothetical protein
MDSGPIVAPDGRVVAELEPMRAFVTANRAEIIARCRARIASRLSPQATG